MSRRLVNRRKCQRTSQRRDVPKLGRWHIATFQRRDVPTSRRLVNIRKGQRTSQRRDVPTLRRQRDFCLKIIKSKRDLIERKEERTEESTENEATVTGVIGKDNRFVFFFSHKLIMNYRNQFQHVLDLFLRFC